MLPLLVALTLSQELPPPPSPPPLVPAAPPLERFAPPPMVEAQPFGQLQVSFMKELELTRQLSAVSLQLAELDVSGPGWATGLRVLGYVLVVPAFLFFAPVVSGNSVVVGATSLVDTTQTLTPTLNMVGVGLTVVTAVALALGIGGGVVGWMLKRWERDALVQQKGSLERQLEAHRLTYWSR